MRGTRQNAIRVGVFVVVSGAILAGGLLWLAGTRFFRPVHTYTVVFERSVSGLNAGANVEYQGVVVGRVRDIRLTPDIPPKVAVIVDLDPATPVRQDTTAALVGSLVTGIKFIQLQGGSAEAQPLEPGGTMPGEAPSLEEFRDRLSEIADRVTDILRNLQQNVFTHENSEKLNHFLDDLGSVAGTLNHALETVQVKETSKDFAKLVKRLGDVADKTDQILGDFQVHGKTLYSSLEGALKDFNATSKSARALVDRADAGVASTGRSVDRTLEELTKTINRLQETLDVIQSDPSLLLRGRPVPPRELER
jgi:phospholipid/cholesterol/gamma-HCH transport system substrate-binding protein